MALKILPAALAAAISLCAAALAQDEPNSLRADPFSALVGKRQPAAERRAEGAAVERYVTASGDRVFLFQSDEKSGRLKFLCGDNDPRIDCKIDNTTPAEEIYILTPSRASRGEVLWESAGGETLLRVAPYGGVTVYWPGEAHGLAASKSFGEDPALKLEPATIETARARAQAATAMVSAKVGAPIVFEIASGAPDPAADASVLADAIVRAATGLDKVADDPTGASAIARRVRRVAFDAGPAARLGLEKGALRVTYNPALNVAGRPSSRAVAKFLEDSL